MTLNGYNSCTKRERLPDCPPNHTHICTLSSKKVIPKKLK